MKPDQPIRRSRPLAPIDTLRRRLGGGDLRSIGRADAVARNATQDPALVALPVRGMRDDEPVFRMRCADALEKATRDDPRLLRPHATRILSLLDPASPKEVLWHVLQIVPRLPLSGTRVRSVLVTIRACLAQPSSIVRTCVLQTMADLARQRPSAWPDVEAVLRSHARSGTPAMRARCARLLRERAACMPADGSN